MRPSMHTTLTRFSGALNALLVLSLLAFSVMACAQGPRAVYDPGGNVHAYLGNAVADRIRYRREGVAPVIARQCLSACTIRADHLRDIACVTPGHRFYFHAGTIAAGPDAGRRVTTLPYTAPMARWIDAQGGLPLQGWLVMDPTAPDARDLWRLC